MQNTHSLKVGDQVRVVRAYDQWLEVGKIYEVTHLWERHPTSLSISHPTRGTGLFSVSHFEKVEAPPAKYRTYAYDGTHFVQRRVEEWHTFTTGMTAVEARAIADALNAAEVA
jgi:hypothetical protein